jgi:dienelactone hydrolase
MMTTRDEHVPVPGGRTLSATVTVPDGAHGSVLFAHGSGSSRHSPRNRMVAQRLNDAGYATVLLDLLTAEEEAGEMAGREGRFDIPLLAGRLVAAVDWMGAQRAVFPVALGLFGASTGAAAALHVAARRPDVVRAVVSRGGRPDLAGEALTEVTAPVLLIVGGEDSPVVEMNETSAKTIGENCRVVIVPGATHLFEEPGALEQVAEYAVDWLDRHLERAPAGAGEA